MKLNTIDGASLMSQPLHPPNFVVDTLLSQGLHILAGSPICIILLPPTFSIWIFPSLTSMNFG